MCLCCVLLLFAGIALTITVLCKWCYLESLSSKNASDKLPLCYLAQIVPCFSVLHLFELNYLALLTVMPQLSYTKAILCV